MGMDQYLIARREGHEDVELMYWRKAREVHEWVSDHTPKARANVSPDPGSMSVELTMDQIGELYDWAHTQQTHLVAEDGDPDEYWWLEKLGAVIANGWAEYEIWYEANW